MEPVHTRTPDAEPSHPWSTANKTANNQIRAKKNPAEAGYFVSGVASLHHAAHATHTAHAAHIGHATGTALVLFGRVGNHHLGGDHQTGN